MSRFLAAACALGLALASTPAHADKVVAATPSGRPEAIFDGTLQDTLNRITNFCFDKAFTVASQGSNEVTCEVPLSAWQSFWGQFLMGNSYSTAPRYYLRFTAAQIGSQTRVQLNAWMELQMAFGQTRRTDVSGATFANQAMGILTTIGGQYPAGTVFTNHAFLGIEGPMVKLGRSGARQITRTLEGSAAAAAGILPGDLIYKVAGKGWRDENGYFDALARAARWPSFEVAVNRGGQDMRFTLQRRFLTAADMPARPSSASPAAAATAAPQTVSQQVPTAAAPSPPPEVDAAANASPPPPAEPEQPQFGNGRIRCETC